MSALELKRISLKISIAEMQLKNQFKTENDIVEIARVVMTDLNCCFKEALIFIQEVFATLSDVYNDISK